MSEEKVVCPACGESDRVFKVSRIYIDALAAFNKTPEDSVLPELTGEAVDDPGINLLKVRVVRAFVQNFSPPSGGKQGMRQIHPDLIMAVFALVAVFFMIQIQENQPSFFLIILAILVAMYLGYFLLRRRIVARFNQQKNKDQAERQRLERAIARWMKLYFCARDEGVFNPEQNRLIPLEEMDFYLVQGDEKA